MPSQNVPNDDDGGSSASSSSSPPSSTNSPGKKRPPRPSHVPATPRRPKPSAGKTPMTVPTPSGPAASSNRPRRASQSQKTQPTLLTDFFLGRQTQARVSAQRRKSMDAAAVKAEVRTAMRRSSVQRLQPPNGVKDRVKAWQKSNAAAMTRGNPDATPSEPTDIAFGTDAESVTEADRLRIKARKFSATKRPSASKDKERASKTDVEDLDDDNDHDDSKDGKQGAKFHTMKVPKGRTGYLSAGTPPTKRIVSDQHWMKRRAKTSPKTRNPNLKPLGGSPAPIPKDFLQRTAQNPSVQSKIKDWAHRVEPPSPSTPRQPTGTRNLARSQDGDVRLGGGKKPAATSWRSAPDDGIRVRPLRSTRSADEKHTTQQPEAENKAHGKRDILDDGIRVRPLQLKPTKAENVLPSKYKATSPPPRRGMANDDGIRVRPIRSPTAGDDIRVRPTRKTSETDDSTVRMSGARSPHSQTTYLKRAISPGTTQREASEYQETTVNTPTRKSRRQRRSPLARQRRRQPRRSLSPATTRTEDVTTRTGDSEDSRSWSGDDDGSESHSDSYGPSTIPAKSLADIPVGFSAFSELDLPVHGEAARGRARASRNASFKGVPNVLKKVVSEGKKIIQDKVDPPRPVVKQPPSIENWLKGTVDPFVEATPTQKSEPAQNKHSVEEQWKKDATKRSTSGTRKRSDAPSPTRAPMGVHRSTSQSRDRPLSSLSEKNGGVRATKDTVEAAKPPGAEVTASVVASSAAADEGIAAAAAPETPLKNTPTPTTTPKTSDSSTPRAKPASGLKRSGATRSATSPVKQGTGKKPFREVLRDAFRGESGANKPPKENDDQDSNAQSRERDARPDVPRKSSAPSEAKSLSRRSSDSSSGSGTLTTLTASVVPTTVSGSSDAASSFVSSATASSYFPRRRPPPTNGDHELSTIVSVESFSTRPSDTLSTVSESTVTQGTTISKTTANLSRQRNQKSTNNLKRRLTKHSDLISVLSLPEDSQLSARTKSIRLARSLHRRTSRLDNATIDDLLQEFSEDESLYRRELKTLVRGVIPVLLTQLTRGEDNVKVAAAVFGADLANQQRADSMAKAVVNMGVSLEKLSLLHEFVPLNDASRMVRWLETAYPVYDSYLDVWRLGFQGVIVNLAPAAGRSAEEDSLVNGMDRNEDGDVLDENGERVDVAYLLRRPLVRIKWMLKLSKGVDVLLGHAVAGTVVSKMDTLNEKARRRNREETARKTDEDASSTDTTRARDLRTLAILDGVNIDQSRQVAAKDWFELSLVHSNGQRLECQVELVFRDKISDPSDRGDVLIRETGGGGRMWLLFPPITRSQISARWGDHARSLVVMIRDEGSSGRDWYELLTLTADHDDTPADWLSILGTTPIPPPVTSRHSTSTRRAEEADVPVGERKALATNNFDGSPQTKAPSRYHIHQKMPSTPIIGMNSQSKDDSIPTKVSGHLRSSSDYRGRSDMSSQPLRADMRPDPAQLKNAAQSQPLRESAPPPPPAHRTIGPKAAPILSPPTARVRRRTSSPLKHEFHASDISSESDSVSQSSGSESDSSSSDELEEDDVPDTLPGISIKNPDSVILGSVVSDSSLTPSNSASQAGLPGLRGLRASCASEDNLHLIASISYWSNRRGAWKDLGETFSALLISPGLLEAYVPGSAVTSTQHGPGLPGSSKAELVSGTARPLIALDLTPLVMIRQSTVVDLEIRSPVRSYAKYNNLDASIFRFRAQSPADLVNLYTAVHQSRMNNAKFKALEDEARFRSFGQPQTNGDAGDDTSSHRRRTWFGRKNSYRASTRAPSQSQGSSSTISATSFLRRLASGGNTAFNINGSSVDRQARGGSGGGGSGGGGSFYTSSGSSSAGGGLLSFSAPRSPSVSLAESGGYGVHALGSNNIKTRCHLQTSANKWEDHGNCLLTIARPPPGVRQELSIYHGLEKRILVVSIPKKSGEKPLVVVDVVVGSACFSRLAARGIVLNVWEEMRDEHNRVGSAPSTGALSGRVRKWCFQFSSAAEAGWVFGLVSSEVQIN